jgi:hypothetical protein
LLLGKLLLEGCWEGCSYKVGKVARMVVARRLERLLLEGCS